MCAANTPLLAYDTQTWQVWVLIQHNIDTEDETWMSFFRWVLEKSVLSGQHWVEMWVSPNRENDWSTCLPIFNRVWSHLSITYQRGQRVFMCDDHIRWRHDQLLPGSYGVPPNTCPITPLTHSRCVKVSILRGFSASPRLDRMLTVSGTSRGEMKGQAIKGFLLWCGKWCERLIKLILALPVL